MNKNSKLFTVLLLGLSLASCGKNPHNFSTEWTSNETSHWHACSDEGCEEKQGEALHVWDEGEITTPATHTSEGETTYTCTVCGETKTEPINKIAAHSYGTWQKDDETYHKKTCACGDVVREEHNWNDGVVTVNPTHTTDGERTYTCTVCGETKTGPEARLTEHVYGDWINEVPATCVADGVKGHYHCTCGKNFDASYEEIADLTISSSGHNYSTWQKDDATNHKKVCSACGDVIKEAHKWNDGVVTTPATHAADGEKTYTCTVCGETKTEVITKIAHTFDQSVVADRYATATPGEYYKSCSCGEASTTDTFVTYQQYDGSEFALRETSHTVSYEKSTETIGGRTDTYKYSGSSCNYADVLGLNFFFHEKSQAAAKAKIGDAIDAGIKYVLFDMYLTTGATFRIYNINQMNNAQGRVDSDGTGKLTYTSLENDKIEFFNESGDKLNSASFNNWMTVKLDISHFSKACQQYVYNTFAATNGTLYLDNVRYYKTADYLDDYKMSLTINNPFANRIAVKGEVFAPTAADISYKGAQVEGNKISNVSMESSNTAVATVGEGKITFVGSGDVVLTISLTYNTGLRSISKTSKFNVKVFDNSWAITHESTGSSLTPDQEIGGKTGVTKFISSTATWNYRLELYETSHEGANGRKFTTPAAAKANIYGNGIKYIVFNFYAVEGYTQIKLNHPDSASGLWGNAIVSGSNGSIAKSNSSKLYFYDSNGDLIDSVFPSNEWVTVVLDLSQINAEYNQFFAFEFTHTKGTFYLDATNFYFNNSYIADYALNA